MRRAEARPQAQPAAFQQELGVGEGRLAWGGALPGRGVPTWLGQVGADLASRWHCWREVGRVVVLGLIQRHLVPYQSPGTAAHLAEAALVSLVRAEGPPWPTVAPVAGSPGASFRGVPWCSGNPQGGAVVRAPVQVH